MSRFFNNTAFSNGVEDDIQEVVKRAANDTRPHKIDLGIGMYRDNGRDTHLFRAVTVCADKLATGLEPRAYLPQRGDPQFLELCCTRIINQPVDQFAAIQTVGGTGAIRLALELVKATNPDASVHIGVPSWSNHHNIAAHLNLNVVTHTYYDDTRQALSPDACSLSGFKPGDVFIMHGPCHNPTGIDLSADQRASLISAVNDAGGLLLLDLAYYGLGDGLTSDLSLVRDMVVQADSIAVAAACSKAFGLYGDRTGALFVKAGKHRSEIEQLLTRTARQTTSSPPGFGAEIVSEILSSKELTQDWMEELESKRIALYALRNKIAEHLSFWPTVRVQDQRGIFSLFPLSREQISLLASEYAIHVPYSGRVNVTGLPSDKIAYFAEALKQVLGSNKSLLVSPAEYT